MRETLKKDGRRKKNDKIGESGQSESKMVAKYQLLRRSDELNYFILLT